MPNGSDILEVILLQNYNTRLVVISTMLLGVAAGLIGSFLLLRKRSLMADALSHATLPGVAIAFAVMVGMGLSGKSLPGLLLGATISGVAGIFTMLVIRNTTRLRDDVAMGFVLSVFFGIGVASLQMVQGMPGASAAGLESFIYGKTASMVKSDFYLIAIVAAISSGMAFLFLKEFLLLCFDDGFAATQGWPTLFLDVLLLGLVTAVTVIGLQSVGLILVIAFLITPPTAARFWTQKLRTMLVLSAAIGGMSSSGMAFLFLKEFLLLCFDDGFAATQGWPTLFLDVLLLGLVTAVTVIGLQSVGLILVIAFLITPPTAARFWTQKLRTMLVLSAAIGGMSGWLGASISALTPKLPAGAVIVLVAASLFLISMLFAPARGVIPKLLRQARLRRKVGRQHLLRAAYELLESAAGDGPVMNGSFALLDLFRKRTWSKRELKHILLIANREDHLEPAEPGHLRLSEPGFGEAARVTRNHRLWETYLIKYADIAPSHVDRDADLVEHILGAQLVQELEKYLGDRDVEIPVPPSPHFIEPGTPPSP